MPTMTSRFPRKIEITCSTAAAGGSKDSGHSLFVDRKGQVYAYGCDRWQQLGLVVPKQVLLDILDGWKTMAIPSTADTCVIW